MSAAAAVLGKDLRLLWRQRAGWVSAAVFAAISVLTYSFALDLATGETIPAPTERDVFAAAKIPYKAPDERHW